MTIKYFFMASTLLVSGYCSMSRQCPGGEFVARLSSDRNQTQFNRMFELAVTSSCPYVKPAISLDLLRDVADLHAETITSCPERVNLAGRARIRMERGKKHG